MSEDKITIDDVKTILLPVRDEARGNATLEITEVSHLHFIIILTIMVEKDRINMSKILNEYADKVNQLYDSFKSKYDAFVLELETKIYYN